MLRSIRIPDALWRRLKVKAATDGVSLAETAAQVMVSGLGPPPVEIGGWVGGVPGQPLPDGVSVGDFSVTIAVPPSKSTPAERKAERTSRVKFDPPITVNAGDDIGALIVARCSKCGCTKAVHEAGGSKTRCERHPSCVWS